MVDIDLVSSNFKTSLLGVQIEATRTSNLEELGTPLRNGIPMSQFEITPALLERVSIDLWGASHPSHPSLTDTNDHTYLTWVLSIFHLYSIYPLSHRSKLQLQECIFISSILSCVPFDLSATIVDEIISICDPLVFKNEVLPFGILISHLCL